jgi:hypothetical protein
MAGPENFPEVMPVTDHFFIKNASVIKMAGLSPKQNFANLNETLPDR